MDTIRQHIAEFKQLQVSVPKPAAESSDVLVWHNSELGKLKVAEQKIHSAIVTERIRLLAELQKLGDLQSDLNIAAYRHPTVVMLAECIKDTEVSLDLPF